LSQLTVFACESRPIVVEGLARVLAGHSDFDFIGAVPNLSEALEALRERTPHIILVDQSAGLKYVFQFIADVKTASPKSHPVMWVDDLSERDCVRALQIGVRGLLKKTLPVESVVDCMRSVGSGTVWLGNLLTNHGPSSLDRRDTPRLTRREKQIVLHVCAGLKNTEIAEELMITVGTVKVHLMHIFKKTRVKDRFELAADGRLTLGIETTVECRRVKAHPERASDST
jgi:two-component system nitrate/nitrite response regulator NarL